VTPIRPTQIIAVTGASGFVGQHVMRALEKSAGEVRLLSRRAISDIVPSHWSVMRGSLEDEAALSNLVTGADAVLHLAGAISAPSDAAFYSINEAGTRRLAQAAQKAGVRRFVHMSSLAAREPQLSAYASSKRAAETCLTSFADEMSIAIIRAPAVYGPGDKATLPLIQQLTKRLAVIPSAAANHFSLIYVTDLAEVAVTALHEDWSGLRDADDGREGGHDWQALASAVSVLEGHKVRVVFLPQSVAYGVASLISAASAMLGRTSMITPGKMRELYHRDWVSKAGALQANPPTGLEEGFRRTLSWYRQAGWLPGGPAIDRRPPNAGGAKVL
jgi:nucleoside-diphosphate-sugar epimerase